MKHVLRTSSLLLVGAPLVDDGLIVTVVVFGTGTRGRAVVGSARGHNNNDERGRCVIGKGALGERSDGSTAAEAAMERKTAARRGASAATQAPDIRTRWSGDVTDLDEPA